MVDRQETIYDNKNSIEDFRDAIRAKESEEDIKSESWTRAKVTNIQVHTGYDIALMPYDFQNQTETLFQTIKNTESIQFTHILSSDDAKQAIRDVDKSEFSTKTIDFRKYDGIISHEGEKYLYKERKFVVGELESVDSSYTTHMIIEESNLDAPQIYNRALTLVDKDVFVSTQDERRVRNSLLGEDERVGNAFITENVPLHISRNLPQIFLLIGFATCSTIGLTFSSFYSFIFAFILMSSVVDFSLSIEDSMYAEFRKVHLTNDISPSSDSRVTNEMPNPSKRYQSALNPVFDLVKAKVDVKEDNSIVISTDDSTWTFESDSGNVVSEDAVEVYRTFEDMELDSSESFILRTASKEDIRCLTSDMYESDNGDKVLKIEYGN